MPEKILPTPIRYITRGAVFHPFSWKERLKILIGYRMLVRVNMNSQHNPGRTQPVTEIRLTKQSRAEHAILEAEREDRAAVKAKDDQAQADLVRAKHGLPNLQDVRDLPQDAEGSK